MVLLLGQVPFPPPSVSFSSEVFFPLPVNSTASSFCATDSTFSVCGGAARLDDDDFGFDIEGDALLDVISSSALLLFGKDGVGEACRFFGREDVNGRGGPIVSNFVCVHFELVTRNSQLPILAAVVAVAADAASDATAVADPFPPIRKGDDATVSEVVVGTVVEESPAAAGKVVVALA